MIKQFFEQLYDTNILIDFFNIKIVASILLLTFFINLIIEKTLVKTLFWFCSFIINLSIIFILIDFDFLGFALFIIYVGSVVILFIFIVMTTDLRSYENKEITLNWKLFFTLIITLILSGLFFFYFTDFFESRNIIRYGFPSLNSNQMGIIGQAIYSDPSLLLFLTFILLLTLIGSMYLLNLLEDSFNYVKIKKERFKFIEYAHGFLEKKKEDEDETNEIKNEKEKENKKKQQQQVTFLSFFSLFSTNQDNIFEFLKFSILWGSWLIPILMLFIPFFIKKNFKDKIIKILNFIFLFWLFFLLFTFLVALITNFSVFSAELKLFGSALPESRLWSSFNRSFFCYFIDIIIVLVIIFYIIHNLFWLNTINNSKFIQKNKHNLGYIYALLSIWLISAIFIFYSESYLHFFILIEILTFSSLFIILIQTYAQDNTAKKQHYRVGLKYIITAAFGSIAMLLSFLIIYQKKGDLSYEGLHYIFLYSDPTQDYILPAIFLFILGLFVKTGVSPFHWWLSSVYGELTNFFFVFFSIVPKILFVGVFTLQLFIFMPFGAHLRNYLLIIAFINLIIGVFSAIGEKKSFKRFFIFSSITHFGHIIVALSFLTMFSFILALTYLTIYLFIFFILYYNLLEKKDLNSDFFNILTFSVLNEKTRFILLLILLNSSGLSLFPFFFFVKFLLYLVIIGIVNCIIQLVYMYWLRLFHLIIIYNF